MKIKIIIIEDSATEKERLLKALDNWAMRRNVILDTIHFPSGENYFAACPTDDGALYILDIQLPGMSGIDIAQKLRERGYDGNILFLTAFRDYVFEGYNVRAMNYLLKPVEPEALNLCLDDVYQQFEENYFLFRSNTDYLPIPYIHILTFYVENHYVNITTATEVLRTRASLNTLLPDLPVEFVQVSRSCIVNMRHIRKISGATISLSNKSTVPISRHYLNDVRHHYAQFSRRLDSQLSLEEKETPST